MKYIVLLHTITTDPKEPDSNYYKFEVEATSTANAFNIAINHYYKEYWTNASWNFDIYRKKMLEFQAKIDKSKYEFKLDDEDFSTLKKAYSNKLKADLGSTDMPEEEFNKLNADIKVDYLYGLGVEVYYFIQPRNVKFIKENL
jgi:hypothetical protein